MEKYELLYILPAKYTEEELVVMSKKIKDIVTGGGGEVGEEHYMGRRKLAYPIKHVRNGHYYLIIFSAEKAAVDKINDTLRLTNELLRHLIIIRDPGIQGVPHLKEEDSIVLKRHDRGNERGSERGGERGYQRQGGGNRGDRPRGGREGDGGGRTKTADPQPDKLSIDDLDKKLDKILTADLM